MNSAPPHAPPRSASDQQQERQLDLIRLRTSPAYLRLREIHLREYRRANDEWRSARIDQIPGLQARATALLEVLELPNSLYAQAGGEGKVFESPGGAE